MIGLPTLGMVDNDGAYRGDARLGAMGIYDTGSGIEYCDGSPDS